MGRFYKKGKREIPQLNTSSLPDLIFTLLFFFMIVTTMRGVNLKVDVEPPAATGLEKLERKSLVTYIYVGKPSEEYRERMGSETRIQVNDTFVEPDEVEEFIRQERAAMSKSEQDNMIVSLKVDKETRMGIVDDLKNALRRAYALKINYSAVKRGNEN